MLFPTRVSKAHLRITRLYCAVRAAVKDGKRLGPALQSRSLRRRLFWGGRAPFDCAQGRLFSRAEHSAGKSVALAKTGPSQGLKSVCENSTKHLFSSGQ